MQLFNFPLRLIFELRFRYWLKLFSELIFNSKYINMKHLIRPAFFKHAMLLLILTMAKAMAWAQDSTVSATTNTSSTTTETWYTAPWVWVVGGAVLILIIVALTRGGGSSSSGRTDKVTITKTTSSETE
jgi:hypothetical protein